jgi:acyl dehydratase
MTMLPPHHVDAFNTAHASENKIHDDAVARQYGFAGGLVPGADVYAYMTHMPVERWGRAWLERGSAECRFVRPLYDGHAATVTAAKDGDGLALEVLCDGAVCATGRARMESESAELPDPDDYRAATPPEARPPADERTLAPGTALSIIPFDATPEYMARYLEDIRETHSLYASEGLVHPGIMLRLCNWTLTHNVALGPWIHASSRVRNYAAARVGASLHARARVDANFERKGHRFVELDVLVLSAEANPVARVAHTAIYRPRQAAECS